MTDQGSSLFYRFGALEARLAELHGIHSNKRTNFQARLKNLHRHGYPAGVGGRAGKATLYDEGQIAQMIVAVELMQAGLLPERLVETYNSNEQTIVRAIGEAARGLIDAEGQPEQKVTPVYVFFDPQTLSPLMTDWGDGATVPDLAYGDRDALMRALDEATAGSSRRLSTINLTAALDDFAEPLRERGRMIFLWGVAQWAAARLEAEHGDR